MLFGTYVAARENGMELEVQTSQTMEDFFFAFVNDPVNGPPAMGWVPFDASAGDGGTMLWFWGMGRRCRMLLGIRWGEFVQGMGRWIGVLERE